MLKDRPNLVVTYCLQSHDALMWKIVCSWGLDVGLGLDNLVIQPWETTRPQASIQNQLFWKNAGQPSPSLFGMASRKTLQTQLWPRVGIAYMLGSQQGSLAATFLCRLLKPWLRHLQNFDSSGLSLSTRGLCKQFHSLHHAWHTVVPASQSRPKEHAGVLVAYLQCVVLHMPPVWPLY